MQNTAALINAFLIVLLLSFITFDPLGFILSFVILYAVIASVVQRVHSLLPGDYEYGTIRLWAVVYYVVISLASLYIDVSFDPLIYVVAIKSAPLWAGLFMLIKLNSGWRCSFFQKGNGLTYNIDGDTIKPHYSGSTASQYKSASKDLVKFFTMLCNSKRTFVMELSGPLLNTKEKRTRLISLLVKNNPQSVGFFSSSHEVGLAVRLIYFAINVCKRPREINAIRTKAFGEWGIIRFACV
jgi:hypothetical protein